MAFLRFEELDVFKLAEQLADDVWDIDELGPRLNAYLKSIGRTQTKH